jgi:hypothetical protein
MSVAPESITDEMMRERLSKLKPYTAMILHKTSKFGAPGTDQIVWEHGRRNFALRASGKISIICPVRDGTDVTGICIFNTTVEDAKKIYDEDPGVKAGIFIYETHSTSSFPGDSLPA